MEWADHTVLDLQMVLCGSLRVDGLEFQIENHCGVNCKHGDGSLSVHFTTNSHGRGGGAGGQGPPLCGGEGVPPKHRKYTNYSPPLASFISQSLLLLVKININFLISFFDAPFSGLSACIMKQSVAGTAHTYLVGGPHIFSPKRRRVQDIKNLG